MAKRHRRRKHFGASVPATCTDDENSVSQPSEESVSEVSSTDED